MSISREHRDLFRIPNTLDKLNLLQLLMDSQDLICDLALALINIVRTELEHPHKQTPSAYRRYGEVTTALSRQIPEVYGPMVSAWQERRRSPQALQPAGSGQMPEEIAPKEM